MLEGKRLLISGVVNRESISWAVADRALAEGASVVLSAFPRDIDLTRQAAEGLSGDADVVGADLTNPADVAALGAAVSERLGGLDGALHAIAFAPREALAGDFLSAGASAVELAFRTSAYSYALLAGLLRDLAPPQGGSIVGLDFDAAGAWPVYNWMGVCKAALESVSRYVARDLGPRGIRSNLVAAGPLHTRAAGGIPEFERLLEAWETTSPIAWDPVDTAPVAEMTCVLLSDLARSVTGEVLHVDGGYHAMASALRS